MTAKIDFLDITYFEAKDLYSFRLKVYRLAFSSSVIRDYSINFFSAELGGIWSKSPVKARSCILKSSSNLREDDPWASPRINFCFSIKRWSSYTKTDSAGISFILSLKRFNGFSFSTSTKNQAHLLRADQEFQHDLLSLSLSPNTFLNVYLTLLTTSKLVQVRGLSKTNTCPSRTSSAVENGSLLCIRLCFF